MRRHDDIVITGKSGNGKSHILRLGLRGLRAASVRFAICPPSISR
ncbi:MAG: hypothetical protein IPM35_31655 [Myxococcales bacterium]|nr:hypothetical protein [Myxococcales bacterium]